MAILGSTGSIGVQTLEVIDALNRDAQAAGGEAVFEVVALIAHRNGQKLLEQALKCRPQVVGLTDSAAGERFAEPLRATTREVVLDPTAAAETAGREDIDVVVHAIVGAAGLPAAFAAVRGGKLLALANKESLVVGGTLLTEAARVGGATILPVDSEHSAVFQAMQCGRAGEIDRVLLTASGGPFRTWPIERIASATVEDALAHPTWSMGGKITVDSATMFNKALEIIEAARLFHLPRERIGVVVHPESIVHSMVEYRDGSTIAQLSPPDMKTPIGYALTYPHRGRPGGRRMDWTTTHTLRFEPPDVEKFPAIRLAYEALAGGPLACVALNAANEVAVGRFLDRKIPFGQISRLVEATMRQAVQQTPTLRLLSLDDLLLADAEARKIADSLSAA